MMSAIFWGGATRLAQAILQAAPFILVGLVVAGIFRRLLGHEGTRRLFGCGSWRELPRAWLIGMLLPVCSLGVIPVAREMKRAGIGGGTILAFAFTAPLFNPLSILYGLTLSEPFVILVFAFCSLAVVTLVGATWARLFPRSEEEVAASPPVAHGLKRMASILVVAAREIAGGSLGYILFGLVGVVMLCLALPPGSLQSTMEHANPLAPVTMVAVALPAYATPMVAMSQLGSMFQHANSVGAAFVLLTLGAGVNLGLMAWMFRAHGIRRGLACLGLLLGVVLGLAHAIEVPLHPSEITPPGHTHAFDIYCQPFDSSESAPRETALGKLRDNVQPHETVAAIVLGGLVALGLGLRVLDRGWRIEDWLERSDPSDELLPAWLNVSVPGPVLGLVGLIGLVVFSIVGCYAYYPAKQEVFDEMKILRGEVLSAASSGDKKHAEHFVPVWADWTRRLQVGVFLREGSLSPYRRMKAEIFRDRLEVLNHAIEEGDKVETRDCINRVDEAYRRLRQAFAGNTGASGA